MSHFVFYPCGALKEWHRLGLGKLKTVIFSKIEIKKQQHMLQIFLYPFEYHCHLNILRQNSSYAGRFIQCDTYCASIARVIFGDLKLPYVAKRCNARSSSRHAVAGFRAVWAGKIIRGVYIIFTQ